MSPQDAAALTAIVALIREIGAWPLFSIFALIIIGPWCCMLIISWQHDKRHGEVVKMYENNVDLVKTTQSLAESNQEMIVLATQSMTKVEKSINSNLYCPLMRRDKKVEMEVLKQ